MAWLIILAALVLWLVVTDGVYWVVGALGRRRRLERQQRWRMAIRSMEKGRRR